MTNAIELINIKKVYNEGKENEVVALHDINFVAQEGELVVILGASGAGKSTLLNILGGMDSASSGQYLVAGEDVTKYTERQLQHFRREKVGFVFQFYNLIPDLTALENVRLAESVAVSPLESSQIIEMVGLKDRAKNFPSQLSGGEQQRVAIARALVKNPALLLADEPTGALDSKTGASIVKLLQNICHEYKKTVIIVTHNAKIADIGNRLVRVSDGAIISNEVNPNPRKADDVDW